MVVFSSSSSSPNSIYLFRADDLLYCNAYDDNSTTYPYYENGDCFFLVSFYPQCVCFAYWRVPYKRWYENGIVRVRVCDVCV